MKLLLFNLRFQNEDIEVSNGTSIIRIRTRRKYIFNYYNFYKLFLESSNIRTQPSTLRVLKLIFRMLFNHPFWIIRQIFCLKILNIKDVTSQPFSIFNSEKNGKVWVARNLIARGVLSKSVGNSLEYDFLRNHAQFNLILWNLADLPTPAFELNTAEFEITSRDNFFATVTIDQNAGYILTDVPGGSIWHGSFLINQKDVLTCGPKDLENSQIWPSDSLISHSNSRLISPIPLYEKFDDGQVIYAGVAESWFHFLSEIAPRILFARTTTQKPIRVVSKSNVGKNINDVIELLSGQKPIFVDFLDSLTPKCLSLVHTIRRERLAEYDFDAASLKSIRALLSPNKEFQKNLKIFLPRKRGSFRPLQNRRKIEKFLYSQGFMTFYPEDFPTTETIKVFNNAKLIVAESGAALTNIMFVPSSATVIELQPNYAIVDFWVEYSRIFSVTHIRLTGKKSRVGREGVVTDGYKVEINRLKKLVASYSNY